MNSYAKSLLLAKEEIGTAWLSYVLSGLFVLFLGFSALVSLSGVFELEGFGAGGQRMEERYNAFFADSLFLLVCAFLGVNAISGDYSPNWRATRSSRLVFLRSLPVPAESLVGSRALCMLLALVPGVLAFFLPGLYLTDLGEPGATLSYLPFAGVWIGYSLLGSGLWLILEFTVSGKIYTFISFGFGASLMAGIALLEWSLDLSLVERTAQLAQEGYGTHSAIFSILAGGAAFALLFRVAAHRLVRRDPSGNLSA